jgi:hypothetical protein
MRCDRSPTSTCDCVDEMIQPTISRTWTAGAAYVAALACAFAAALWLGAAPLVPPDPMPADAPASAFSAGRAFAHVNAIAARPHPIESTPHAEVLTYLVNTFAAIGVEGIVHESRPTVSRRNAPSRTVTVRNLVVTIPGTRPSKALLLAAHYDTTSKSPGASDNGAAVAALLETARALVTGPRLANDVIFLFTDGEEAGLLGARAFMQHPVAASAGLVLNFDARGRTGPVVMFETAGPSLALVRTLARSVPSPVATSFSEDVYKRMPHRTDFTVFKRGGLAGMNFAFFAEPRHYHQATDSIANLDPGTLQHQGDYALALTRAFGNIPLPLAGDRRAVYFNVGAFLAYYPESWAPFIAILILVVFLFVVWRARTARLFTIGSLLIAATVILALLLACTAIGFAAERWLAGPLHAKDGALPGGALYFVVIGAAAVAATFTVLRFARRRIGSTPLVIASHAWWTLLALVSTFAAPGASYLFVWPALTGVLVQMLFVSRRTAAWDGASARIWLALPALVAAIVATTAIALTYAAVGAAVTPIAVLFFALIATFLQPAWRAPSHSPQPSTASSTVPAASIARVS